MPCPPYVPFLGQRSLGCRTDGEQCRCFYLQSDQGRIAPTKRFFCDCAHRYYARRTSAYFLGKRSQTSSIRLANTARKCCDSSGFSTVRQKSSPAETSGLRELACLLFCLPYGDVPATPLSDAEKSWATARQCCEVSSCLHRSKKRPRRRCKSRPSAAQQPTSAASNGRGRYA